MTNDNLIPRRFIIAPKAGILSTSPQMGTFDTYAEAFENLNQRSAYKNDLDIFELVPVHERGHGIRYAVQIGEWPPEPSPSLESARFRAAHPLGDEARYPHKVVARVEHHLDWVDVPDETV